MEKIILWGKEIEKSLEKVSEKQLDEFLELVQYIHTNGIQNIICERTSEKVELWEWLYSKEQVELNDIKREMSRYIEKAKCVDEGEFDNSMDKVGRSVAVKTLVLLFDSKDVYYISTKLEYYTGIRSYLAMEKKDNFCKDLQECFPNIYFDEGIETAINTLNRKFEDIREEIVVHLTQINNYQIRFRELLQEHKSYREIAQKFSADTGIECSPQAGRKTVQALKGKFINSISGKEEDITCELHTKFETFNTDKEKQDRIYFFPGEQGIVDGKIIVKHIGTHL